MKETNRLTWEEVQQTRGSFKDPSVGLLFPVCDGPRGDEQHFDRFTREIERLGFPFVVHFDHCSNATKAWFKSQRLFLACSEDDDPDSFFDESFRQRALDVLLSQNRFTHYFHMDVDETLEKDARRKIIDIATMDVDVTVFRCLDLWGDGRHYRVDGPFASSQREKVFRLAGNDLKYPHPSAHAPNVIPRGKRRDEAKVVKSDLCIHHWGIMDLNDAKFHKDRWDAIYTRKLGGNPYGGYDYYFDPSTVVATAAVLPETIVEEYQ